MAVEAAGEVGHHHDRSLEDADEQQVATLVVGLDLAGDLLEALDDLRLGEQGLLEVEVGLDVLDVHAASLPQVRGLPRGRGAVRPAGRRPA